MLCKAATFLSHSPSLSLFAAHLVLVQFVLLYFQRVKYLNMYNFGDEFAIESYRIPWLVWIQVMVMLLLLMLLYCFISLVGDFSDGDVTSTTTTKRSSYASRLVSDGTATSNTLFTNRLQNTQVGESIKGEIVTSTSRIKRREEIGEMEASAAAAATHIYLHPCYYFRLARLAFLKCLGFDSTSEYSSTPRGGNRKES